MVYWLIFFHSVMYEPTTEKIAAYMQKMFLAELKGYSKEVQLPSFSLDLLEERQYAVKLLVKAANNPSKSLLRPHSWHNWQVCRKNELVSGRLRRGARTAEQALQGSERTTGAGVTPSVPSEIGGASISSMRRGWFGRHNTVVVFARAIMSKASGNETEPVPSPIYLT